MGDILVNIAKDVNFNKVVTKDIFKTVFADVVNPDQLAEAEADAEAFGEHALAQTDTFGIVTETEAFAYSESTAALDLDDRDRVFTSGGIDIVGNTDPFVIDVTAPAGSIETIVFQDIDDVNPEADLEDFNLYPAAQPGPGDTGTPDLPNGVTPAVGNAIDIEDLVLESVTPALTSDDIAIYQVANDDGDFVINYGPAFLHVDYDGNPETPGDQEEINGQDLRLVIPTGAIFEVENPLVVDGVIETTSIIFQPLDGSQPYVTFDAGVVDPTKRIVIPELIVDLDAQSINPDIPGIDEGDYGLDWFAQEQHFAPLAEMDAAPMDIV